MYILRIASCVIFCGVTSWLLGRNCSACSGGISGKTVYSGDHLENTPIQERNQSMKPLCRPIQPYSGELKQTSRSLYHSTQLYSRKHCGNLFTRTPFVLNWSFMIQYIADVGILVTASNLLDFIAISLKLPHILDFLNIYLTFESCSRQELVTRS